MDVILLPTRDFTSPWVFVPIVLSLTVALLQLFPTWFGFSSKTSHIPLVGEELGGFYARRNQHIQDPYKLYNEGYYRWFKKDKPFKVTHHEGERIVVPRWAMEDLQNAPEDIVNKNKAFDLRVLRPYTGLPSGNPFLVHCIKSDLTRNLSKINNEIVAAAESAVEGVLGPCEDWTPHIVYRSSIKIIGKISGTIFVGEEVTDELINDFVAFSEAVLGSVHLLQRWPAWMRPLAQYFKTERTALKRSWGLLASYKKMMIPMIQARREKAKHNGGSFGDDMLGWLIAKAPEWKQDDDQLAGCMIQVNVASIQNPTLNLIQVLYLLAIRPQLCDEMRDEVRAVRTAFADSGDGILPLQSLNDLKLMDSVLKEAQRLCPMTPSHFHRSMDQDLTLRDGTLLPKGSAIEGVFAAAMFDPDIFPDPYTFDARRFMKLRSGESPDPWGYKNKEQYTYSHATKENLVWGYGVHACPGRFLANSELKLTLAYLLTHYDFRMPGGVVTKEMLNPPKQRDGMGWAPDMRKPIEFKRRR